jgi:hypothetical protein
MIYIIILNIQYHRHLVSRIMKATKKVAMAEQRKAPSLVEFIISVTMMMAPTSFANARTVHA